MRFLANENFPRTSVNRLREISYDIASVTGSIQAAFKALAEV